MSQEYEFQIGTPTKEDIELGKFQTRRTNDKTNMESGEENNESIFYQRNSVEQEEA
jgi:hypothetical protein